MSKSNIFMVILASAALALATGCNQPDTMGEGPARSEPPETQEDAAVELHLATATFHVEGMT